jgi:hypothetical protein
MIHLRFEGKSYDLADAEVEARDDRALLESLARRLDVSPARFDGYVVDRRPTRDIIVHPEAVYG